MSKNEDAVPPLNSYKYMLQHKRVYRARGNAKDQQCASCPRSAHDWARIHTESGNDPWADYVPLCRACHIRYDEIGGKVGTANRRRGGKPFTASHGQAISRAMSGRRASPETRARISAALSGKSSSKITPGMAVAIKQRYATGTETHATLAREFDVSTTTIARTLYGGRKKRN